MKILCKNCNGAKGLYGICPHETARKEETFTMMVLAVAIISIVAVTAKSRVVPRFYEIL